jgi:hypothetical protein
MAKTMPPLMQMMRDIGRIELLESLVKLGGDENKAAPHPPTESSSR